MNGTFGKNQKHLLQISVQDMQNDMILPISQGVVSGARTFYVKVCIGDTSLRKYMPKYI